MEIQTIENGMGKRKNLANGEDWEFKCWRCRKDIKEGYMCENFSYNADKDKNFNKVWCTECHIDVKMTRCAHDKRGEHKQLKIFRDYGNQA